jgi:hypothetical protein
MNKLLLIAAALAGLVLPAQAELQLSPPANELRRQYEEWGRDHRVRMDHYLEIVADDLDVAATVLAYNESCAPLPAERVNHAHVLVEAFPDLMTSYHIAEMVQKRIATQGRDHWCRWTKGTPKPLAP